MHITELSDAPYIGAPYSKWYILYNQKNKELAILDENQEKQDIIQNVFAKMSILQILKKNLAQKPERCHYYDVCKQDDEIRFGMAGNNTSMSIYDLPTF